MSLGEGCFCSLLHVDNAKQIAISSAQQQIRKAQPEPSAGAEAKHTEATGDQGGAGGPAPIDQWSPLPDVAAQPDGATVPAATPATAKGSYSWYGVELTNRSITDEAKRDDICKHLRWLISQLKSDANDHQLISLKYDMMVATDAALAAEVEARGNALQAKVQIRADEM